jgi:hypothetical protein
MKRVVDPKKVDLARLAGGGAHARKRLAPDERVEQR